MVFLLPSRGLLGANHLDGIDSMGLEVLALLDMNVGGLVVRGHNFVAVAKLATRGCRGSRV